MSLEIRIAASTDAFAACSVLRRSISECCVADHKNDAAILDAWLGNKTPQMVANWFSSPTNFSLVALLDGELVGVALLTGVGKALLARMEEQACSWGVKALQLHSTATGESFFAAQGYIEAGKVRSPYGVETIFFWKQLDAGTDGDADGGGPKRKRFCNCNSA
jgi:hypothetical protein